MTKQVAATKKIQAVGTPDGMPRRRGRPRRDQPGGIELSRDSVLDAAFAMTRSESLDTLSMVRVAAGLGVSPSLVHYYLDSRDALVSGVINRFSRVVWDATRTPLANPRQDIEAVATSTYDAMLTYPGVVAYLASNNRFRFVQMVGEDEVDYGVQSFERLAAAIMGAGYAPADAALLGHLVRMFILASAQAEVHFQTPGFHKGFLDATLNRLERAHYPGLHHSLRAFATLKGREVFQQGLQVLLDGFELRQQKPPAAAARLAANRAAKPVAAKPADKTRATRS